MVAVPDPMPSRARVGAGLVTVGWMPCECPEAQAGNLGHLWVSCAAPGCPSIWYRPAHSPGPCLA
jgi:hypothetical protein